MQNLNEFLQTIKSLTISSLDENKNPFSSYAPYVKYNHKYYVYLSLMAKHSKNLTQNKIASIFFSEDEKDCSNIFAKKRVSIQCNVENSVSDLQLNDLQKVSLYRILEEALSNTVQHANATSVGIYLKLHNRIFSMEIVDNGIGYDQTQMKSKDGFGLMDMKQRALILEGQLTITGNAGKGTTVKVEIPYPAK